MASRAADRENKKRRITEASGPVESLIKKDPSGNGPSLLFRSCLFSFGTGTAECGVIVSCDFSFYPPFWLPVQLAICYGILVSARSFVGLVGEEKRITLEAFLASTNCRVFFFFYYPVIRKRHLWTA